jgi:hypothetical protein
MHNAVSCLIFVGEWFVGVAYSVHTHKLDCHYLIFMSSTIMKSYSFMLGIPMFGIISCSHRQLEKRTPHISSKYRQTVLLQ